MNVMAQFVNHLLTPGSALSGTMQTAFNAIMLILFVIWGVFLASMPDSVHVWIFGVLILGLTLSTNWFLNEVMKMKEEIAEDEKKEKEKQALIEEEKKEPLPEDRVANVPSAVIEETTHESKEEKVEQEVRKRSEKMKTKRESKKEM
jgi:outer membrane biosynthesis protein TonB